MRDQIGYALELLGFTEFPKSKAEVSEAVESMWEARKADLRPGILDDSARPKSKGTYERAGRDLCRYLKA